MGEVAEVLTSSTDRTLWRACDFILSMTLWGYDLAGDACEVSAAVAEGFHVPGLWDRRRAYLAGIRRSLNGHHVEVPEWWALPHLIPLAESIDA